MSFLKYELTSYAITNVPFKSNDIDIDIYLKYTSYRNIYLKYNYELKIALFPSQLFNTYKDFTCSIKDRLHLQH